MSRLTSSIRFRREALNLVVGLVLLAVLVFLPSVGRSTTISWRGDYETGNLLQWHWGVQAKDPSRVAIVDAPLRQGRYAARFEVRPGDSNVAGSGNGERAEVLISSATTDGVEGHEAYWGWSTYFPSDFTAPAGGWNIFTQFHHTGSTGQSNVIFDVRDMTSIGMRVYGGSSSSPTVKSYVLAPLQKGHWYDFVLHVKWSASASVGFVEMWINGNRVVPKVFTPTLYAGMTAYAKQGYYRSPHTGTTVVYQDGMRRGSTYDDVAAEFPSSTPAPVFAVTSSIATGSTLSGTNQWTATPSGKTPSAVTFSIDDEVVATDTTAPFTLSLDTTKLANTSYTFRVDATATDGSKASASSTATVRNLAPLSVTQNLADGQTVSGSLPWTASTSGRTVSKVDFSVNGQVVATDSTAPYSVTYDTTRLANGTYPFSVKAFATDGTTATASAAVKIANVAVTSPLSVTQNLADGQTVSGSLPWTASTSGRTVSKVDFSVNGQVVATDSTAPYSVTYDTTRLANGTYPFSVKAFATDGTTATASAAVKIANAGPAVSPSFTVSQNVANGARLAGTLEWKATPAGLDTRRVEFYIDGKKVANEPRAPYATSVQTTKLSDGPHVLRVTAIAVDGTTASSSADVVIANTATPQSSSPTATLGVTQNVVNGQSLSGSVSWTASPTGLAVTSVEFYVDGRHAWTESIAPYAYGGDGRTLDTRTLANGSHTLEVRAYARDRSSARVTASVSVSNGAASSGTASGGSSESNSGAASDNRPDKAPGNTSGSASNGQLISSIRDGQRISGLVTWTVDPRGFTVSRMEFFIDSKLMWTEQLGPYVYAGDGRQLDTGTLNPGMHSLEVRALGSDGSVRTIKLRVTVT